MYKSLLAIGLAITLLQACGTSKNTDVEEFEELEESFLEEEIEEEQPIIEQATYRATETVFTDLVHTRLDVNFDWTNSTMNGIASITAKPHFYASDSLILDAKGMQINSVKLNGLERPYKYENEYLRISLDKKYLKNEKYTVVIDYVARPEERKTGGSAAITSDKGLYFINPKNEQPGHKPHIWTQGETEASSVWFPTIDAPNVKTSQEIFMTVQDKYVTLSNGKMMSSQKNDDGTRTDHWKQELPHAPYLFMMAVGEFAIVKDTYTKKDGTVIPVNYYVEKEWEQYAKDIFGETPAMIAHFSEQLGVEYPWDKYTQIIVRDYVSGAMENTGAVIFGDYAYKTKRELLDANDQSTIAHELFHHWFGDLVTAESWSNLTLNESFANYSQYLWDEKRFGRDEADYQAMKEMEGYFNSAESRGYHDLVWFEYEAQEQMFDGHSYNKGGRILNMLRNHLGDEAFFAGLKKYLTDNQFKAAEFHQLRLAFEEVSGRDLNWFFNQWYQKSGHPFLEVIQDIDQENQTVTLTVNQVQDVEEFALFQFPVDLVIYDSNGKRKETVWVKNSKNTYSFSFSGILKCLLFDEKQVLLAEVEETKPIDQYIYQYYNGDSFKTRLLALEKGVEMGYAKSDQLILDGLNDSFWKLREVSIERASQLTGETKTKAIQIIANLSINDAKPQVRSAAIDYLAENKEGEELKTLMSSIVKTDQSYSVVGAALNGLSQSDPESAMAMAKDLEGEPSNKMKLKIGQLYGLYGKEAQRNFFDKALKSRELAGFDELQTMNSFTLFNSRMTNNQVRSAIPTYDALKQYGGYYTKMFLPNNVTYLVNGLLAKNEELKTELKEIETGEDSAEAVQKTAELNDNLSLIEELKKLGIKE